jgi:hypothetical protein
MTKLIEDLLALQSLLRIGDTASPEQKAQIEALRASVPEPILAHFLRQLAAGRKGIALVRNGVCGECHLRVSHAMNHLLGKAHDLLICENCGAYLAAAPVEATPAPAAAMTQKPKRRRTAKKPATGVVTKPLAGAAAEERATDVPLTTPPVTSPTTSVTIAA